MKRLLKNFIESIFSFKCCSGQEWLDNPEGGYVAIPYIVAAIAAAAAVYSTVQQSNASKKQAALAQNVADYNAKVDVNQARQSEMDAQANIQKQRIQDEAYLESQRTAYSASGILGGTGSPMEVLSTTAGRMEQDIQQDWTTTEEKSSTLYSAAKMGLYEGDQQADTYHLESSAEIFSGIGQVANIAGGAASYYGATNPSSSGSSAGTQGSLTGGAIKSGLN